jgi:peroxiredoxin
METVNSTEANSSPDTRADGAASKARLLRRVIWAMALMLGVSLVTNLLLAYRVKTLGDSLAELTSPPPGLQVGATVSPIKAHALDGQPDVIAYGEADRPVVLYVFTPQCSWCARNLANLKALLAHEQGTYRFVGLSLTDKEVKDYASKNGLDFPVYFNPTEEAMREYKLGGTPQTIVISRDGKVLKNWVGAYTGQQQTEVEQFFQLSLPGLATGN